MVSNPQTNPNQLVRNSSMFPDATCSALPQSLKKLGFRIKPSRARGNQNRERLALLFLEQASGKRSAFLGEELEAALSCTSPDSSYIELSPLPLKKQTNKKTLAISKACRLSAAQSNFGN